MAEINIASQVTLERPDPTPNRGSRRIVKMVPTPVGMGWAIWTSPYTIVDPDVGTGKEPCRLCVVLIAKGPPKPEPVVITIPDALLARCPEDSVEW